VCNTILCRPSAHWWKVVRNMAAHNFQSSTELDLESGNATTFKSQATTQETGAVNNCFSINCKTSIQSVRLARLTSWLPNSTAASTSLSLAWTRQAACDWACADTDSAAPWYTVDVIINLYYPVFITSRSLLIWHLESLSDLLDSDQDRNMSTWPAISQV